MTEKVDTTIAVCQCGATSYDVKKQTSTAVVLQCKKCSAVVSVKGAVAPVRSDEQEVQAAVTKAVWPIPPKAQAAGSGDSGKPTLAEQGFITMRFRVSKEAYENVINPALEVVRIMNFADDAYRAQQWQGLAVEAVMADFLAGADPRALQVLAAMQEAVEDAVAACSQKEPGAQLPRRKVSAIWSSTRETMVRKIGLAPEYAEDIVPPEERQGREEYEEAGRKKEDEQKADPRLPDEGKMFHGLAEFLVDHSDSLVAAKAPRPQYFLATPSQYTDIIKRLRLEGGLLFRVEGDRRTKDKAGAVPMFYLWAKELETLPDLAPAYDDLYSDLILGPELSITELLADEGAEPSGYAEQVAYLNQSGHDGQEPGGEEDE